MIRIIFYRNKCIGCNACVEALRSRWRISRQDGKSVLIGSKEKSGIYSVMVPVEEFEQNKKAADNCPVNIIRLTEK